MTNEKLRIGVGVNMSRKRKLTVFAAVLFVLYLFSYFVTTTVRPRGTGGLSGPRRVRVFASEEHLMAFYPLYLAERWKRNLSIFDAHEYFNVDFADGRYRRFWLYADGQHGRIWYDFW